jgi:hypothetical protein
MPRPSTGQGFVFGGVDPAAASLLPGALHDPGERDGGLPEPLAKCRSLWASVVLQAVSDSCSVANDWRSMAERADARRWLSRPSRDRDLALEMAGMDVDGWGRAVAELRRRWAVLDTAPPAPRRAHLSPEARRKIGEAAAAFNRQRAAQRAQEQAVAA